MGTLEIQIKITQGELNKLYNEFTKQNEEEKKIPDDVYAKLEVAQIYTALPALAVTSLVMCAITVLLAIFHNIDWAIFSIIIAFFGLFSFFNWLLFNPKKEIERLTQKKQKPTAVALPIDSNAILNERIRLSEDKVQIEGSQGSYEFLWADLNFYKANQEYIYFGYFVEQKLETAYFPKISMEEDIFIQFKKYCEDIIFNFYCHLVTESIYILRTTPPVAQTDSLVSK